MKLHDILVSLGVLAGLGSTMVACAKPTAPTAPTAPMAPSPTSSEEPPPREVWERTWTLSPGDMAEINLELAAGDTMEASFSTDGGTLAWNVHSHQDHEVTIHAEGNDATGQPRHVAAVAGMCSFLWENEGEGPVVLTVQLLAGADHVHSTHPSE